MPSAGEPNKPWFIDDVFSGVEGSDGVYCIDYIIFDHFKRPLSASLLSIAFAFRELFLCVMWSSDQLQNPKLVCT